MESLSRFAEQVILFLFLLEHSLHVFSKEIVKSYMDRFLHTIIVTLGFVNEWFYHQTDQFPDR